MTATDYILYRRYRDDLRRAIAKLIANPTASESVSTPNGGSRSVSYASLSALQSELRLVEAALEDFRRSLHEPLGVGINYARYC